MRRLENSCLAGAAELAASRWRRSATTGWPACPARCKCRRATVMGLAADVVLLLDVDGSRWSLEPRNPYVAASRARLRLHVFVKEGVVVPGGGVWP